MRIWKQDKTVSSRISSHFLWEEEGGSEMSESALRKEIDDDFIPLSVHAKRKITPPKNKSVDTMVGRGQKREREEVIQIDSVNTRRRKDTTATQERKKGAMLSKKLPLFATASAQEIKDVLFVLEMEKSESGSYKTSDVNHSIHDRLETRKREILGMIRNRKKNKKLKDEEIESIKTKVTGEFRRHRMMMTILALQGKRCCGEMLPTPEQVASYIFKYVKGKDTSAAQKATARIILKHIVL